MLWMLVLAGAGLVVVGVGAALVLRRRRQRGDELVSIVLLRRRPRGLSEAEVRGMVRRAFQGMPGEAEVIAAPPPDEAVVGAYVVAMGGAPAFYIIDAGRAYCDDPADTSTAFEDPTAREAYAAHGAWVSVDIVGGMPSDVTREFAFAIMGRLAAELLDDQCTLLYAPALRRVALPDDQTEGVLRGSEPMQVFGDDAVNTPIVRVETGDTRVERAMEEARRQWPRFVVVWERDGAACEGLVKGRFEHEDGNEYMWIRVEAIEGGRVKGELLNEPAHVAGLTKGQSVSIPCGDVADWACVDGDKPRGMFVERVLARM